MGRGKRISARPQSRVRSRGVVTMREKSSNGVRENGRDDAPRASAAWRFIAHVRALLDLATWRVLNIYMEGSQARYFVTFVRQKIQKDIRLYRALRRRWRKCLIISHMGPHPHFSPSLAKVPHEENETHQHKHPLCHARSTLRTGRWRTRST